MPVHPASSTDAWPQRLGSVQSLSFRRLPAPSSRATGSGLSARMPLVWHESQVTLRIEPAPPAAYHAAAPQLGRVTRPAVDVHRPTPADLLQFGLACSVQHLADGGWRQSGDAGSLRVPASAPTASAPPCSHRALSGVLTAAIGLLRRGEDSQRNEKQLFHAVFRMTSTGNSSFHEKHEHCVAPGSSDEPPEIGIPILLSVSILAQEYVRSGQGPAEL